MAQQSNGTKTVNGGLPGSEGGRLFSLSSSHSIDSLKSICAQTTKPETYPLAASIDKNVPIYNLASFESTSVDQRAALQDEWYHILLHGPGVFVTKGLFADHDLLDRATAVFHAIIEEEKKTTTKHGDHFAGAGKNDRVWNVFSKHGVADPSSFIPYYSNPYLGLISAAWLGPGYRITAQVNNVKPGASAQVCHRDYHLGFMSTERCSQVPRAMQLASQCLTLQGAVAHVDVPLESGPTRLLPFSQTLPDGYMAYRLPEFGEFFQKNHISLPLDKGDGLFFNPALFHAAGENQSQDINRLANLLQISSPFGKPMESIDALPLVESCWDGLQSLYKQQGMGDEVKSFIAAIGEGYPFPTNLDRNPPRSDEMAPLSEQDVLISSLESQDSKSAVVEKLKSYREAARA